MKGPPSLNRTNNAQHGESATHEVMLLGIVSDIHDRVDYLRVALSKLEHAGVEQVITLGDAIDTFAPGEDGVTVCKMLEAAGAIGVWGNHDAGASLMLTESIRQNADPAVLEFAKTLQPYIVVDNTRFSHVEHWLDARDLLQLWHYDGAPDTVEKAQRSFDAVPQRYLFLGHFHRWLIMTPDGPVPWTGENPIRVDDADRYLIVIAPVMKGWCATFDTDQSVLTPVPCTPSSVSRSE